MKVKLSCGRRLLFSEFDAESPVRLGPVLMSVRESHPGIFKDWCADDGTLRKSLAVFVNGEHVRYKNGMQTELRDGDEVYVIPLIAGG